MTEGQQYQDHTLYKEWFRTSSQAGFLSITPWFFDQEKKPVNKMIVDIGSVDPANNTVLGSTKCFIDAIELAVFCRSVANGTAKDLFPNRGGVYSPESFVSFGGSGSGDHAISRVFKIEWWGAKKDSEGDSRAFAWKCGHFQGKASANGAIEPDYSKPLSSNMMRRTRLQMAEISYRLDLALVGVAAKELYWFGAS